MEEDRFIVEILCENEHPIAGSWGVTYEEAVNMYNGQIASIGKGWADYKECKICGSDKMKPHIKKEIL